MPRRVVASTPVALSCAQEESPTLVNQVRSLLGEAQALSARLAALNEVAVAIQADLNLDEILQTFAREARWVLDFQICSIALCEGGVCHEQFLRVSAGQNGAPLVMQTYNGAIRRAIQQGQALLIERAADGDDAPHGMESAIILPLRHIGEIIGTVNFYAREPHAYSADDLRIAYALAMQVNIAMQNARMLHATQLAHDELHTVLESISDAVFVINTQNSLLLINTAMCRIVGVQAANVINQPLHKVLLHLRWSKKPVLSASLLRLLRKQWRDSSGGTVCLRDNRYIEWAAAPLQGGGNGFVITARDISERVELERMRDTMMGMLVHDLRTPLTGLIMALDLLNMYEQEDSFQEFKELLGHSRTSANRLLNLINTILDVRKMQAGYFALEWSTENLRHIAERALHSLKATVQQLQIKARVNIDPFLPLVRIDTSLVQRVLENLLSNALKYTPVGGTVMVNAYMLNCSIIEVLVIDSGPGVPGDQQQHIFEMYGQARSTDARHGTGIGLTFCRLAVEAHGGKIGVRSRPGCGSIFWFTLPIGESEEF